jgi:hypothetical protein
MLFCFTQETRWESRIVTISSYCASQTLFASDDSNSNFFVPKRFQTHFFCSYNIRNNGVVPILFCFTRENSWQSCMVTVSSYCDSQFLFASNDSNSNFFVSKRFQTHFFRSYNIKNTGVVPILFRLTRENWWQTRMVTVSSYCESHSLFASYDSNSNFFCPGKVSKSFLGFKVISFTLRIIETTELSRFCSVSPKKIVEKDVSSRFLPTVPHKLL